MDENLKKRDSLKIFDGFLWVFTTVTGVFLGAAASLMIAVATMVDYQTEYDNIVGNNSEMSEIEIQDGVDWLNHNRWAVNFQGENMQEELLSSLILMTIILGVVFVAGLVLLCVFSGRFAREADGGIHLNLFDRIWSELLLAAACGAVVAAVFLGMPMTELWAQTSIDGFYESVMSDQYWFGPSNRLVFVLCIAGMAVAVLPAMLCIVSIVKKLKAHKFWDKSLLGKLFAAIARGTRNSVGAVVNAIKTTDNFMMKYVGLLIGMTILAMTRIGAVVDLVLIFIFVPKKVKKLEEIRKGVSEVRDGKLSYKIPVNRGIDGKPESELDLLAADINKISEASEIAIQNELKNQRMKTDLISNVSHDLKTPLTSMVSYVDLLKKEGLDSPNAPEYLKIIDEKTDRLRVLTENLFEAAKASSGAMPVHAEAIDLGALVSQSLGEMDSKLRAKGLVTIVKNGAAKEASDAADRGEGETGSANVSGQGPKVLADGQLLWRVIENLLSNASKYALENSRVYIDISRNGEMISLEVKNISKEQLNISSDELMERFTRGDASRNTEGSGLGLAIARDLVKLMDGSFELTIDGDLFKASVTLPEA